MKEENNLLKKVGTKNPFKVPNRYFENFSSELMNKLPEKDTLPISQEITFWQRIKPWLYMTAMFCGIMLSVKIFVGSPNKNEFPTISESIINNLSEEDWELIVRQSMIDDYTLYQYLTNEIDNLSNH